MSEETQIRRLPTAMIVAVAVQTLGGLIWAGGAAARITTLEQRVGEQRLVAERLARLEPPQTTGIFPRANAASMAAIAFSR